MKTEQKTTEAPDGAVLAWRLWRPEGGQVRGVMQICHGMAEHGGRYERLARRLIADGFAVAAADMRGHGLTAGPRGHLADRDGWRLAVDDVALLAGELNREFPSLPLFLFGHSMGSFIVQDALTSHAGRWRGAILSATSGRPPALAVLGRLLARFERMRLGPRGTSALMRRMSFDDFNRAFRPNRTAFDWLSRDEAEVDAYIADPFCGFDCTVQLWIDMLDALGGLSRPERLAMLANDLPVLLIAGSRDPVSAGGRGTRTLADAYRKAGLDDVTVKIYDGGRHELLNETNREEVMADIAHWCGTHL